MVTASNGGKKFYPLQTGSLCPCEATAALASLTSGRSEPDLAPSLLPLPAACCADARFAVDSPLEEAVSSEPVSERIDSGPHGASTSEKKGIKSERYEPIPYASEQGIFCGLAGNLNRRSGKFPPRSGNPALVRYLGPTGPTNPILPRDLERLPRSKEGRRQMLA